MKTCDIRVDTSRTDYDSHGSFWRQSDRACGVEVHRIGLCRAHFAQHVRKLQCSIEYHAETAARLRAELSGLTDTACAGAGSAACVTPPR